MECELSISDCRRITDSIDVLEVYKSDTQNLESRRIEKYGKDSGKVKDTRKFIGTIQEAINGLGSVATVCGCKIK